jgi:hypothetical protein
MPKGTLTQATTPSDEQTDRILDATADSFERQLRSPILHAPSEQDLDYEDVTSGAGRRAARGMAHPGLGALLNFYERAT